MPGSEYSPSPDRYCTCSTVPEAKVLRCSMDCSKVSVHELVPRSVHGPLVPEMRVTTGPRWETLRRCLCCPDGGVTPERPRASPHPLLWGLPSPPSGPCPPICACSCGAPRARQPGAPQ